MQAALHLASLSFLPLKSSKTSALPKTSIPCTKLVQVTQPSRPLAIHVTASAAGVDAAEIDYGSMTSSVFPAEACETIGGEACDAEMYPEVKLEPETKGDKDCTSSETVDRDYLEYNTSKTVFPGEACDDLGGEFCEPEYQSGVY